MRVPKLRFKGFNDEWILNKVGNICDFIVPGRNKPTEFKGDIPWITTPDIEQNGIVTSSKKNLNITIEEAKIIGSKIVPKNSILISCVGDLGLIAISGADLIINQQLHAFLPKENIYSKFLLYALTTQKPYMEKVATKTAVPYMNKDNCNSIPVIMPSLPEQTKIANFLTAIDEKIAQLTQKCDLLAQYKKGVMQQIFSQKLRFKDDDGQEFPEWEEKKLGEIVISITNGLNIDQTSERTDYKVTRIETISDKKINVEKIGYVMTDNDISEYKLKIGDILFSNINSINHIGKTVYLDADYNLYHGMNLLRIIIDVSKNNSKFISYQLNTDKLKNFFESIANKAVSQASINQTELKKTKLVLPTLPEQTKIANFLTAIDGKITQAQVQLEAVKRYKKGLLQQMFV
ncbi:MAG: restriction endonuclease subunit S [Nitrosomonas sp.]